MVVFILRGVVALITLMATATTVAIALSQHVQTVHFVYDLFRNVSMAWYTQKDYVQPSMNSVVFTLIIQK